MLTKWPTPPFTCFSFYSRDRSSHQILNELFRIATKPEQGPVVLVNTYEGPEKVIRAAKLLYDSDLILNAPAAVSLAFQLEEVAEKNKSAYLTNKWLDHGCISPTAKLWTSGEAFDGPKPDEMREAGWGFAHSFFLRLCRELRPSLAALGIEEDLQTPRELIDKPDGSCFASFYLSSEFGAEVEQDISAILQDAYREKLPDGVYYSTYERVNAGRINLTSPGRYSVSQEVANYLSRLFRTLGITDDNRDVYPPSAEEGRPAGDS